ncbi:hypothetical protein [Halovivax limisalsi]|uniref:hypothetical protein n=1 Tax=Halovivax limisalsi TaxID=1453760 RepID=UPI001FFD255A|nr:hypothetical protein [Halovivax limisalsi]
MDESYGASTGDGFTARGTRWLLLTGNRLLVSLLFLLGVGSAFVVVAILELATVTTPRRMMWFLNGAVNGLLTLIPITVGVNQIVLSHEFGSIEDLRERRTTVTEFRERVEDLAETGVASPHASTFFQTLLSAISATAEELQHRSAPPEGGRTTPEIGSIAESIGGEADRANEELDANGESMLRTLLVVLFYRNSHQFHEIRRLRERSSDRGEGGTDGLQRMYELFLEVDAARQFLKTVVVERQLARLSRYLVYTGIPAVTVAAVGIFTYRDIAGVTLPRVALVAVAGTIVVSTLAPLAVLSAYVLQVATIARRTAAYGPFVPESDE